MKQTLCTLLFLCNSYLAFNQDEIEISGIVANLETSNVLYRHYPNKIGFSWQGECDSTWIVAKGLDISYDSKSIATITPNSNTERKTTITLKCLKGKDTLEEEWTFRIINVPNPEIYLGRYNILELVDQTDSVVFSYTRFFAKYPSKVPLSLLTTLHSIEIDVNSEQFILSSEMDEYFKKAIFEAPKGSKIVFKKAIISGTGFEGRTEVLLNVEHIKTSEANTFVPYKSK